MAKVTKDVKNEDLNNLKTSTKKAKSTTTKKKTVNTFSDKKSTTAKNSSKTSSTAAKKTSTTKKASTKKKSTSKVKKIEEPIVAEYYDLPYRYNETIVKILYQTPTILFVYWDISDSDRNNFINKYGNDFFNTTKPILKIFNLTKNYNFEVEINDFANSWYINVDDANCDYKIELARKQINFDNNINSDYIYISSSNDIELPNDHILLEKLTDKVNFRNVKTSKLTTKNIGTLHLVGINKIYSSYDFYKRFFKDELLEDLDTNKKIINTSSSSSSWN